MQNMDKRTLNSMLNIEENYKVNGQYFNQKIKPEMRSKLATWMLEVCEEQECTDEVYATAMNIFDRLMCVVINQVEVYHLQLLGSVCLFIASKLSSSPKLTAVKLIDYTDNSISLADLLEWELFIMDKLRWDVCSIVPNEFIDIFLAQFNFNYDLTILKKHCYAFTAMCATDFNFSKYPSSMIASACLLNALEGLDKLNNTSSENYRLVYTLNSIVKIDIEFLLLIKDQVSELFKQSSEIQEVEVEEEQNNTTPMSNDIQFEDDYDFDIDFNLNLDSNDYITESTRPTNKYTLAKTFILSPAPSSPASSSGVSSTSSLSSFLSSSENSSYYTNQDYVSMMMVTPPLANSLPMPEFDCLENNSKDILRRSTRHSSQRLIRC